ncbi:Protein kinase-like domain superfamily [Arabidopsis suecica]|uniref:Protein kinase-like domain superfamily n=1 Tax=Arabidopsis suecica TaxID=45249 RepID=A0A8T1YPF3_ARASU|nr:Protein kinase-like domain superfamily [Arabidopsis suecica]
MEEYKRTKEEEALSKKTELEKLLKLHKQDRYMAPEVFRHRRYDKKVDVFSFAMILYEMLEGEPPFANHEPYEAAKHVSDGHRPTFRSKGCTPDLRDWCFWEINPSGKPVSSLDSCTNNLDNTYQGGLGVKRFEHEENGKKYLNEGRLLMFDALQSYMVSLSKHKDFKSRKSF